MKEKIKDALAIIVFLLLIGVVYFKDVIIKFFEDNFTGILLEKGFDILLIIIALCSFCLVVFLLGYGIYLYLKNYSKKGF